MRSVSVRGRSRSGSLCLPYSFFLLTCFGASNLFELGRSTKFCFDGFKKTAPCPRKSAIYPPGFGVEHFGFVDGVGGRFGGMLRHDMHKGDAKKQVR